MFYMYQHTIPIIFIFCKWFVTIWYHISLEIWLSFDLKNFWTKNNLVDWRYNHATNNLSYFENSCCPLGIILHKVRQSIISTFYKTIEYLMKLLVNRVIKNVIFKRQIKNNIDCYSRSILIFLLIFIKWALYQES